MKTATPALPLREVAARLGLTSQHVAYLHAAEGNSGRSRLAPAVSISPRRSSASPLGGPGRPSARRCKTREQRPRMALFKESKQMMSGKRVTAPGASLSIGGHRKRGAKRYFLGGPGSDGFGADPAWADDAPFLVLDGDLVEGEIITDPDLPHWRGHVPSAGCVRSRAPVYSPRTLGTPSQKPPVDPASTGVAARSCSSAATFPDRPSSCSPSARRRWRTKRTRGDMI